MHTRYGLYTKPRHSSHSTSLIGWGISEGRSSQSRVSMSNWSCCILVSESVDLSAYKMVRSASMTSLDVAAGQGGRGTPLWGACCRQRRRLSSLSTILEALPDHHNLNAEKSLKLDMIQDEEALALSNFIQYSKEDDQEQNKGSTGHTIKGICINPPLPSPAASSRPPSPTLYKTHRRNSSNTRFSVSSISSSILASLSALAMATSCPSSASASLHNVHHSPTLPHRNAPFKSAMCSPRSSTVSLDAVTEGLSSLGGTHEDSDSLSSASASLQPKLHP